MLVADLSIMGPKSQADALTSRGTHAAGSSPNGHGISAFFNIVSRITPDLGLAPLGGGRRPYFPRLSAAVHAVAPRTEPPPPRGHLLLRRPRHAHRRPPLDARRNLIKSRHL